MRSITEVWDYRLSTAQPILYPGGIPGEEPTGTWIVCVYAQDDRNEALETHDTKVAFNPAELHEGAGIDACYEFLRKVRDKYSRDEIDDLKPAVALIREADKLRQKATDAYDKVMKGGE